MDRIDTRTEGEVMVVVLPKIVDGPVVRRLRALLAGAVGVEGIASLDVDLSYVERSDDELPAALQEVRRRLHGSGQRLRLHTSSDLHLTDS